MLRRRLRPAGRRRLSRVPGYDEGPLPGRSLHFRRATGSPDTPRRLHGVANALAHCEGLALRVRRLVVGWNGNGGRSYSRGVAGRACYSAKTKCRGDQSDHLTWLMQYTPVFDQAKVPLVIQAHMHGYERFETPNGRTFVTSAGGGGIIADPSKNLDRPYCNQRVAGGPYYHAMIMDVTPGKLAAVAIDDQGKTVDQFEKVVP